MSQGFHHAASELPGDRSFQARSLLRQVSVHGAPLEHHCGRVAEFALALGQKRAVAMPADLIVAAAYLHDIGLCVEIPSERSYLKRGLLHTWPHVQRWRLSPKEKKILEDVMLYSHAIKRVPGMSPQGEMVRRAVQIEHSLGRFTHGLDGDFCRSVFAIYPRRGFNRVLLSFFKTALVYDGPRALGRVFFPDIQTSVDQPG